MHQTRKAAGLIRILAIGDVVGRAGRRCLELALPPLREQHAPDCVIINGENAAGGFGITEKICRQFFEHSKADVITTGNHWLDKPEIKECLERYDRLLLPSNMHNVSDATSGHCLMPLGGKELVVVNLTGRVFMKGENRCPFLEFDRIYHEMKTGPKTQGQRIFIVDFHAEATSEKQAFAHYVTGRASLVFGTHTHCPTGDERIIDGYTAYQTDLGMTGAYHSVIGMSYESVLPAFLNQPRRRFEPAKKGLWLCGLLADLDLATGAAAAVERIRFELDP